MDVHRQACYEPLCLQPCSYFLSRFWTDWPSIPLSLEILGCSFLFYLFFHLQEIFLNLSLDVFPLPTASPPFFFFFSCYRFLPFCNSVPLVQQLFNSEQRQVYMYLYVYLYSPVFELEPSLWHIHFTLIVLLCYSKTFNVFILLTG